jgi:glycosyltransferase involved in cell wall biosynthesis
VWGGIGTYVTELVRNMPDDVTIHVVTPKRSQLGKTELSGHSEVLPEFPKNVHVHYVGTARDSFMHYFYFQLACRRIVPALVKKYHIDLIHSQNTMPDLLLSLRRLQIPIITTIHTTIEGQIKSIRSSGSSFFLLESSERMSLLLSPLLKFLENQYYKRRCYFITVSEWAKNEFAKEKNIEANRIEVIHNGITADSFSSIRKSDAEQHFPGLADIRFPKVLYFSRLVDKKGIRFLTKAIPKILSNCDAYFIFAGVGRELKLGIPEENYTYLGYVEEEKKPYLYALSDIFILPSLYENCPISVLEAMASGMAVIATSVGGIPEIIKHEENGLLIQPRSDDEICEAVTRLVENESLRLGLGINAKKTIRNNFAVESSTAKTKSSYGEMLANHAHYLASRESRAVYQPSAQSASQIGRLMKLLQR